MIKGLFTQNVGERILRKKGDRLWNLGSSVLGRINGRCNLDTLETSIHFTALYCTEGYLNAMH